MIEREGRAGVNPEESALRRGVQRGAVAVDGDVRADGDADLRAVVVAVKDRTEHDRGPPAGRDIGPNFSPRNHLRQCALTEEEGE